MLSIVMRNDHRNERYVYLVSVLTPCSILIWCISLVCKDGIQDEMPQDTINIADGANVLELSEVFLFPKLVWNFIKQQKT